MLSFDQLLAFLRRYHRHWLADPTLPSDRIPDFAPPPLARLYRELGALAELESGTRLPFHAQDCLVAASRLELEEGAVVVAWENQGNWSARCRVGRDDPAVESDAGEDGLGGMPYRRVTRTLTHFLTSLCLQEAVLSSPHLSSVEEPLAWDQVLTIPLRPLWTGGRYAYGTPTVDVFVSDDEEVLVMNLTSPWIGSRLVPVASLLRGGVRARHSRSPSHGLHERQHGAAAGSRDEEPPSEP